MFFCDDCENVLNWRVEISWLISFAAENCMGFACSCLTVCEEGGIVSIENRLNQMRWALIDFFLFAGVVDLIESEYFFLVIFSFYCDRAGVVLYGGIDTSRMSYISASR